MIINKPINYCSWYIKRFYSTKFWICNREDLNQIVWVAILSCEPHPECKVLLRTLKREIYHFYKSRKPYASGPIFGEKRWNDKKMYDKGYENSLIDYIDINLPVRPAPRRRTAFSLVERQAEMKIRYGKKKRVHLTINS